MFSVLLGLSDRSALMDKLSSAYGGSQSVFADQIKLVWEGWGQGGEWIRPATFLTDGQSLINKC